MIITQGTKTRRKWHKFPLYQVPKIPLNSPPPLADPWLSQNFMHHMTSHDNTWHHNPHVSVTLVLNNVIQSKTSPKLTDWHWFKSCHAEPYVSDVTSAQKWHGPHFSNKALPPSRQQQADSWLGRSAASLLTDIEISTFHVTQSLKCHMSQVLKMLNKVKKSWPPSSPPRPSWRLAGWQLTEGAHRDWLLPGSQLVRLSPHPPPSHTSLTISTLFHGGSLRFPQDSCLSGPSPFST